MDIDHFKKFNDKWGHQVGDQLLRMVGFKLAGVAGGGTAFRYGGEEFTLLFPGQRPDEAMPHIVAVMESIRSSPFTIRGPGPRRGLKAANEAPDTKSRHQVGVTVSIGVSATRSPTEVLREADRAVYMAKDGGRDRLVSLCAGDAPPEARTD